MTEAEGQTDAYLVMLVQLGRVSEAINYPYLSSGQDAFRLATALHKRGLVTESLQVAERGLTMPGSYELAKWLIPMASQAGRAELSLQAAVTAFKHSFNLPDYQTLKIIAGAAWDSLKSDLLSQLAQSQSYYKIEIYSGEGMITEAIQVVEQSHYLSPHVVQALADKAIPTHTDWVIQRCTKEAETIMNAAQSKNYSLAVDWLQRVKAAYGYLNEQAKWQNYLNALLTKHARKSSLCPLLKCRPVNRR